MPATAKKPRIGAHTPTTGGMAKRSIEYAQTIGAEAIQVFASNPRQWSMPMWLQIMNLKTKLLN